MCVNATLMTSPEFCPSDTLSDDAVFTLIDMEDDTSFVVPRVSLVPKLVAEMEAIRLEAGLTVEDLLEDLAEQRQQLYLARSQHDV